MRQYPRRSSPVAGQNKESKQSCNRKQCASRRQMDEGARKLRTIGSFKERFLNTGRKRISQSWYGNRGSSGYSFRFIYNNNNKYSISLRHISSNKTIQRRITLYMNIQIS